MSSNRALDHRDALPLWWQVKRSLGFDRCHHMICGSAPIAAHVKDFLRVAVRLLHAPVQRSVAVDGRVISINLMFNVRVLMISLV